MNAVFRDTAPADVVIVNSDTVVPAGWLERLRAAAYSDGLVATASTLSNHGTILSVPDRDRPSPLPPPGLSITETDDRIARASPRLYPRIPTGVGHCLYIRRSALELVGEFDEAFSPGYGEEVDFSQRCLARGLWHVVADDLYVYHRGAGTFGTLQSERQLANEAELNRRYPLLRQGGPGGGAVRGAAARALDRRRAARGRHAVGHARRLLARPDLAPARRWSRSSSSARSPGARTRAARHGPALARRVGARRARRPRRRADLARRGRRRHRPDRHRPPALPGDHAARPAAARPARAPRRAHPARRDRLPQPRLLRRLRAVVAATAS